ncbi:MAG TPA: hypothetical protein VID72_02210 [Ktedonobacterales bacterium]
MAIARRSSAGRGASVRWPRTVGLLVALSLLLAACDVGGASGANSTPTLPAGQATATLPGVSGTATPSPTPLSGGAAQAGATEICVPSAPLPISISVPAEIPPYPNGQLRLASAVGSNNADFGYCTPDSVSVVAAFYTQALPGKGWQNIQTFVNLGTENIIGTRGSGESVTITISPDSLQSSATDLLIIVKGL